MLEDMKPEPLFAMMRLNRYQRLPMHAKLRLYAGGDPVWKWRSAMFKHNKKLKPGPRRLAMRGRSKRVPQ